MVSLSPNIKIDTIPARFGHDVPEGILHHRFGPLKLNRQRIYRTFEETILEIYLRQEISD